MHVQLSLLPVAMAQTILQYVTYVWCCGFVDNVMFNIMGPIAKMKHDIMFCPVH